MGELLIGIIIVALAVHRAARAISTDTISDRPRAWVYDHAFRHPALEPVEQYDWTASAADEAEAGLIPAPEERIAPARQTTSMLWAYVYGWLSCPHCCGWWLSIATWALWWHVDSARVWVAAVAVAGLQSVISAKGMVAGDGS